MNNLIRDLITKQYSKKYIIFFNNDCVYINNNSFKIKEENWKQIKRRIDLIISNGNECKICYEEFDKEYHTITCKECDNVICFNCYINILKTNNGTYTCPYCKKQISYFSLSSFFYFMLKEKYTINDYDKMLLDKARLKNIRKEKVANIKCPRCNTYKYEEDFINNKNRVLKTCIDCRERNKKYRQKNPLKENNCSYIEQEK
jgi:hypothetical protein